MRATDVRDTRRNARSLSVCKTLVVVVVVLVVVVLVHIRYKFQSNTTIYYTIYSYGNMFRLY